MQKKYVWAAILAVAVLCIALIMWLAPANKTSTDSTSQNIVEQLTSPFAPSDASPNSSAAQRWAGKSQQDTLINCQLSFDQSSKLIVNSQTKDCFEYFITQVGEKDLEQIKLDFKDFIEQSYQEPAVSQILNLWTRYLQYREQLGQIQQPNVSQQETEYYKQVFNSIQSLRQKIFSSVEISGLFGQEDIYNQYTIKRMEITENKKLSEIEKAKQLRELFEQLPMDWQENLEQINKLQDLTKLTEDIKARGGSESELRQMRLNLVGPEATERLEKLDVQKQQWKSQVTDYLAQRETIKQSNMSDQAKQKAIDQLRSQHFSNKQEQLRVGTFETAQDQGATLPFFD